MEDKERPAERDEMDEVSGSPADENSDAGARLITDEVRGVFDGLKSRMDADLAEEEDVVREYEERYSGTAQRKMRLEAPPETIVPPPKMRKVQKPRRQAQAEANVNERKWAALAHGSTLLTALVALGSGGAGVLVTMMVPLMIYFAFRKRSDFVAFHALQAFTIQLVGTVGFLTLLITGLVVWVGLFLLSLVLALVLVGFVLAPLFLLLLPIFLLGSLALPLGMVVYSVIATFETWKGHDYRYPFIARWVEHQIYTSVP